MINYEAKAAPAYCQMIIHRLTIQPKWAPPALLAAWRRRENRRNRWNARSTEPPVAARWRLEITWGLGEAAAKNSRR